MVTDTQKLPEKSQPGWRFHLGLAIFVVGFASPLLIPLVTASALPTRWKAIISGALAVGIPEVSSIAAIAIMGKSGFNFLKARFFSFIKKHGPPDVVSRIRYRIGLILFGLPLLFAWLAPYTPQLFPGYYIQPLWVNIVGDLMFVSSLFVLGGDFWDKVRSLFIHEARAQIPAHKVR